MFGNLPRFPEASPDAAPLPPAPGKTAPFIHLLQFAIGTALVNAVLAAVPWGVDVRQMITCEAVLFFAFFGLFGLGITYDEQVTVILPQLGLLCGLVAGLLTGLGLASGLTFLETRGRPLDGMVDGVVAATAFGALLGMIAGGAVTLLGGRLDVGPSRYLMALGQQPLGLVRRVVFGERLKREIRLPGQPWIETGVWIALVAVPVLWVWHPHPDRQILRLHGHRGPVRCLAFSPDGKKALSGGQDAMMRLWDLESGQELRRFKGHTDPINGVAFSPDGRAALSGSGWMREHGYVVREGAMVSWWDQTGDATRRFKDQPGGVAAVAFCPDGQHAVSAGEAVQLRDVGSDQQVLRLYHFPFDWATSVTLSADARGCSSAAGTIDCGSLRTEAPGGRYSCRQSSRTRSVRPPSRQTAGTRSAAMMRERCGCGMSKLLRKCGSWRGTRTWSSAWPFHPTGRRRFPPAGVTSHSFGQAVPTTPCANGT